MAEQKTAEDYNARPYEDSIDIEAAKEERAGCAYWLWYLGRDKLADEGEHGPLHQAIRESGHDEAEGRYAGVKTPREFAERFLEGSSWPILKLHVLELTDDAFEAEFNECPLVAAWKELGATPEQVAQLCDIAMEEDRGVIDKIPTLHYELKETIAQGSHHCVVRITKA